MKRSCDIAQGLRATLLMQRPSPQRPWLQGYHPDHLTNVVDDLHSPAKPLLRGRRDLGPEFLDRLYGVGDNCIDVCKLEALVVTDNLFPIGQIEIITGRHVAERFTGSYIFHIGAGRRIEKSETTTVHGFSTYPQSRTIVASAYTCGRHGKDRLDRSNFSANLTPRWDSDDGNPLLYECGSPARPI